MKFEMDIPSELVEILKISDKNNEFDRNALLLYPYILNGTVSFKDAAKILNIDSVSLFEYYYKHNMDINIDNNSSIAMLIKTKNDIYMDQIDDIFIKQLHMNIIDDGIYGSNDNNDFFAIIDIAEELMKDDNTKDFIEVMLCIIGREVDNLKEEFLEEQEDNI